MTKLERLKEILAEINLGLIDIEIDERTMKKRKVKEGFNIKDNNEILSAIQKMEQKLGAQKEGVLARQEIVAKMIEEEMEKETSNTK